MSSVFIYGLVDPRTEEVRYVGKALDPETRRKRHLQEARSSAGHTHRLNWLRGLLSSDLEPSLQILEETCEAEWQARERHWIDKFPNLTNATAGGEGGATRTGQTTSRAHRRKISQAMKGKLKSATHRERLKEARASQEVGPMSEDAKRKLSESRRGILFTKEHREKLSAARKGRAPWNKGLRKGDTS